MDFRMAWRNVWRNPRRTILTVSTVAFACFLLVFIMSFQFGGYETMINSSVKIHTGHIQVQAKGFQEKKKVRMVIPNPEKVDEILKNIPGIEAYAHRGLTFSIFSSGKRSFPGMVTGIDPKQEPRVSNLKTIIRKGSYPGPQESGYALVGESFAKRLKIGLGDEIVILGQGREGAIAATVLKLKGIYRSGLDDFDRYSLHMSLKDFQDTFSMRGAVHKVVVNAGSLDAVPGIRRSIQGKLGELKTGGRPLVALDWEELMPGLKQGIEMDLMGAVIFYVVLVLVVAFGIMNTFLMAVFERTGEFGVLMAMGTTPRRLTKLLLMESLSMTAVGIGAGIALGVLVTLFFQSHGIDISGTSELLSQYGISGRVYTRLSWFTAFGGPGMVLAITFIAALYPALKVRRLRPAEALMNIR